MAKKFKLSNAKLRKEIRRLILDGSTEDGIYMALSNESRKRVRLEYDYLTKNDDAVINYIEGIKLEESKENKEMNEVTAKEVEKKYPDESMVLPRHKYLTVDQLKPYYDQMVYEFRNGVQYKELGEKYLTSKSILMTVFSRNMSSSERKLIANNRRAINAKKARLNRWISKNPEFIESKMKKEEAEEVKQEEIKTEEVVVEAEQAEETEMKKINLLSIETIELVLVAQRHDMPVDNPLYLYIHSTKVNDFPFLEKLAYESIRAKGIISYDGSVQKGVILYVTGLSQALTSAIKVLNKYKIPTILKHYDANTKEYVSQSLLYEEQFNVAANTGFADINKMGCNNIYSKIEYKDIMSTEVVFALYISVKNETKAYLFKDRESAIAEYMRLQNILLMDGEIASMVIYRYSNPTKKVFGKKQVCSCEI